MTHIFIFLLPRGVNFDQGLIGACVNLCLDQRLARYDVLSIPVIKNTQYLIIINVFALEKYRVCP